MNLRVPFITAFLLICFSVSAQETSFQQKIVNYLNINGTQAQYSAAYDEMFVVLPNQFDGSIPTEVLEELKKGKKESVEKVVAMLASAYRKHFKEDEITDMLNFYKTDAGKQMVHDPYALTQDQRAEINSFFGTEVGQKISEKQQVLSRDISEISEFWSRDLFAETVELLTAKGYRMRQH